ncbi:MAG: PLP-dependent transferase, partial [Flavobacteriaceae bacterium]|nr:PLP-dependent transferase [Flavobacteriaceae bacterium]
MKFNTKTIHGGQQHDPATGAVMPPVYQTSTYAQSSPGKHKGYEYSRAANPTRSALEANLAAIENGTHGFAFASGLAALDAVLKLLNPGDEVIAGDDLYGGTYRMFTRLYQKYNIKFHFVNTETPKNIEKYLNKNTKLVWLETPTNPLMKIADIQAIA